ncbi:MAG: phosphatidate cytidylyltransferase [Desulfobacteraceae bacterium]
MQLQRWLTALIGIPLLLLILLKGSRLHFALLILAVSGLAHWEYLAMTLPHIDWPQKVLGIGLGLVLTCSFGAFHQSWPIFLLVLGLFVYFLFYLLNFEHSPGLLAELGLSCLGLVYVPFLLGHFIWLRVLPEGQYWVLWLLAVTFANDTGAYYAGRWFGECKLYPSVSPGKTVIGSLGGLILSLAAGIVLGRWLLGQINFLALAGVTLILALIGQLGDLFVSMLKRRAQIKDTGHLLPGHGGMLDRLDSLLFAGTGLYYIILFFLMKQAICYF